MTEKPIEKVIWVIDAQNDFVSGSLGTPEAQAIIPKIKERLENSPENEFIIFTQDTHFSKESYSTSIEGKHLPVHHCEYDTEGWQIVDELRGYADQILCKSNFWMMPIQARHPTEVIKVPSEKLKIEVCGLCTDICVIANIIAIKAQFPNSEIYVNPELCAGTTPEKHDAAIQVMESLQVNIIKRENE